MESTQRGIAYIGPDRGVCIECGQSVRLQLMTGYIRRHGPRGDCPGGGLPPVKAKAIETVPLPEP